MITINNIKFGSKGLRDQSGKYYPASYSKHISVSTSKECITVYSKKLLIGLPKELTIENNTDSQSDYFEKDKVRFHSGSSEFNILNNSNLINS